MSISVPTASRTGLVLAGAVAKGAFQAGALEVLHRRGLRFARVVAASSGAINGAYWAAAIRAGREDEAARALPELWRDRANTGIFHLNPLAILGARGISTGDRIADLLEEVVGPWLPGARRPVELRVVVTSLRGVPGSIGGRAATTHQHVVPFDGTAFDTREGRAAVFRAAAASGAFPGVFVPVELPGVGACVDGGAVNNAPIKEAIGDGEIDRVVVATPHPLVAGVSPVGEGGLELLGRIADILINERLFRDLREAEAVNQQLAALERLHGEGIIDGRQLEAVRRAVDLAQKRVLEIVQVRPPRELSGNPFSAFFSRKLREEYVEAGRQAATDARWSEPAPRPAVAVERAEVTPPPLT
jgi:NTE family protein